MASDPNCTILFADIVGSTQLYETIGDAKAQQVMACTLNRLSDITRKHRGVVVKTIGDEVLATFPTAADAVLAAKSMHQNLDDAQTRAQIEVALNIRVGFHEGPVIREADDIFGDAVNLAARMVKLAKPRQILTTKETVDSMPEEMQEKMRWADKTRVKGKSDLVDVYEVVWEREAVTILAHSDELSRSIKAMLRLRLGDKTVVVNIAAPSVSLGRQAYNDLVVDSHRTSRSHARIECRRGGKFVLIDESSNGTYLHADGKEPVQLTRDEAYLAGSGVIGLGFPVEDDAPNAIHFEVKS